MSKTLFIKLDEPKQWKNTKAIWDYIKNLPDGKRYKITIERSDKRSNPQNRYYWQMQENYILPLLREIGWEKIKTKEDAHEFTAEMFLKVKEINENTGEERFRIRSTTELTKMEFCEYLEDIWRWAAEYLGAVIPGPNEQLYAI